MSGLLSPPDCRDLRAWTAEQQQISWVWACIRLSTQAGTNYALEVHIYEHHFGTTYPVTRQWGSLSADQPETNISAGSCKDPINNVLFFVASYSCIKHGQILRDPNIYGLELGPWQLLSRIMVHTLQYIAFVWCLTIMIFHANAISHTHRRSSVCRTHLSGGHTSLVLSDFDSESEVGSISLTGAPISTMNGNYVRVGKLICTNHSR